MNPKIWVGWFVLHGLGALLTVVVRRRDRDRDPADRRSESLWTKYGTYLAISGATLYAGSRMTSAFKYVLYGLGWAMHKELNDALAGARSETRKILQPLGYALIGIGLSGAYAIKQQDLTGEAWGWFWLVIATNDGYAQLFGQGWGESKMAPRVSPGKTWEGFLLGTTAAVLAGTALGFALAPASRGAVALVALLTAMAATAGDLLESWMKRAVGIKDFSTLLGSHGGLLDRFDSLLVAAPVFAVLLWWLSL